MDENLRQWTVDEDGNSVRTVEYDPLFGRRGRKLRMSGMYGGDWDIGDDSITYCV